MSNKTVYNDNIELLDSERQKCEVWTRVMGYYRLSSYFNIGKQGEFNERVCFSEEDTCAHLDENELSFNNSEMCASKKCVNQ